jgi:hypothetical protein
MITIWNIWKYWKTLFVNSIRPATKGRGSGKESKLYERAFGPSPKGLESLGNWSTGVLDTGCRLHESILNPKSPIFNIQYSILNPNDLQSAIADRQSPIVNPNDPQS